ncbi:MAG: DNA repair protein RecN [Alphaproteobacteria bacterium]|nr:DNA repair protein RecN [Alphaproteobacteria bacterium]
MLNSLTINNIVLIDRLHIEFEDGLCVLSGETGAGKSILMDSLGLALGQRSGRDLVRHGCAQAGVTADFYLPTGHNIWSVFDQHGLDHDGGQIILRRLLNRDGRNRAYINDQPVSIALLREIGGMLVEIHGQHDDRGLLNPAGHRKLLDNYGRHQALLGKLRQTYGKLTALCAQLEQEQERLLQARADEDYVRHNLRELEQLAPEGDEEQQLAEARSRMMQGEAMSAGLKDILASLLDKNGIDTTLRSVIRRLSRMALPDKTVLDPVADSLDRAANETAEAILLLEETLRTLEFTPEELENTEERLFALRAAARKHHCPVDDLPVIMADFTRKCRELDNGDDAVHHLQDEVRIARGKFHQAVAALSAARNKAARQLDRLVNAELPPLRMEKADFITELTPLAPSDWSERGGERIEFRISTLPGAPFGGLIKVASGGELSRFILALKVVLAQRTTVPTLVFDEIDQGVGGAVADAVGARLKRLSAEAQILVITHSPQVAARAAHHWLIEKTDKNGTVVTTIISLGHSDRREEIARMLAGAEITAEARAAAQSLLQS